MKSQWTEIYFGFQGVSQLISGNHRVDLLAFFNTSGLCTTAHRCPLLSDVQGKDRGLNFFAFDIRKALIVLIVIALPLLSINMKRSPGEEPWYRKPVSASVSVVQSGYSTFTSGVRSTTSMYLKLIGIKKRNLELLHENEELRAKLGAITELKLENERLTKLLDFKRSTNMSLLAAKVIARDLSPDHYAIRINRGTRHGLKKLMGVITVEGVVGYVLKSGCR